MQLQELFNRSHDYQITVNNKETFEADFEANGRMIEVQAHRVPRKASIWEISFHEVIDHDDGDRTVTHKVTGHGDELAVLSTVVKIIDEFLDLHQPDGITFTSEKEDRSRSKVYAGLVKRFMKKGWKVQHDPESSDRRDYFTLTKE